MIIAIAWIFLRQRLNGVQLAGVAISLAGVLAILSGGSLAALARQEAAALRRSIAARKRRERRGQRQMQADRRLLLSRAHDRKRQGTQSGHAQIHLQTPSPTRAG